MAEDTKAKEAAEAATKAGIESAAEAVKNGVAPKTIEEAQFHALYYKSVADGLNVKLKETTEESIKRKEKLRTIEQEKTDAVNAKLKADGDYKTLSETLEPKAKRADELEKALKGYFDLEIVDVPEDKRNLIPAGSVESQLTWLKAAKAQGIFGLPKKAPLKSGQEKPDENETADFLTWAPTDTRLQALSRDDYNRWKSHNNRGGTANSGTNPPAWGKART